MNRFILFTILIFLFSCGEKNSQASIEIKKEKVIKEYGYTLNNYNVKKDTIESGDSFGLILEKNNLFYPKIYDIVQEAKKVFDIRKINIGIFTETPRINNTFFDSFTYLNSPFFIWMNAVFLI